MDSPQLPLEHHCPQSKCAPPSRTPRTYLQPPHRPEACLQYAISRPSAPPPVRPLPTPMAVRVRITGERARNRTPPLMAEGRVPATDGSSGAFGDGGSANRAASAAETSKEALS